MRRCTSKEFVNGHFTSYAENIRRSLLIIENQESKSKHCHVAQAYFYYRLTSRFICLADYSHAVDIRSHLFAAVCGGILRWLESRCLQRASLWTDQVLNAGSRGDAQPGQRCPRRAYAQRRSDALDLLFRVRSNQGHWAYHLDCRRIKII